MSKYLGTVAQEKLKSLGATSAVCLCVWIQWKWLRQHHIVWRCIYTLCISIWCQRVPCTSGRDARGCDQSSISIWMGMKRGRYLMMAPLMANCGRRHVSLLRKETEETWQRDKWKYVHASWTHQLLQHCFLDSQVANNKQVFCFLDGSSSNMMWLWCCHLIILQACLSCNSEALGFCLWFHSEIYNWR